MQKKGKHWTKSKNINSKRYKRDLAEYLNGRSLKCVTERIEGIEEVIGKSGAIIKRTPVLFKTAIYSSVFKYACISDIAETAILENALYVIESTRVFFKNRLVYVVSLYCHTNENNSTVTIIVVAAGIIILKNILYAPAPSTNAASSVSLGTFLKN